MNKKNLPIPYRLSSEAMPGVAKARSFDPRAARHVFDDEPVSVDGYAVPDCERDVPIRWRVA